MSIQAYSVDRFIGLNQSGDENLMSPACTPDAANMCTDGGELRVAYGFTRLFEAAVPGTLRIDFFTLYRTNGAEIPVVIAGGVVYAYMENAWTPVYTYQSTRSKPIYDCAQVRINTTDYLVIADGQHGMIKFDGSSVTQFGSEENASNIPQGIVYANIALPVICGITHRYTILNTSIHQKILNNLSFLVYSITLVQTMNK